MLTYNYFLMQFKEVLLFSQIQKFFNIHYYLYCISQFSLTICYNVFFYLIRILSWYKFIASSANEALRVEFSTSSNFTWGSAQTKDTGFWGSLLRTLRVGSAQTPGQAEPVFTRPRVLRFRLRACAPINRQSPQRASSRLERGALWRSLAQPCARKPRNVSV